MVRSAAGSEVIVITLSQSDSATLYGTFGCRKVIVNPLSQSEDATLHDTTRAATHTAGSPLQVR